MESIITTLESGPVSYLTINRPESLNAINFDLIHQLYAKVTKIDENEKTQIVVLRGAGDKAFAAGADIAEMYKMPEADILAYIRLANSLMQRIERAKKIYIAVVDGYALGGGLELALSCDLIMASTKAQFGLPEVTLELIPGFGGTQRLLARTNYGVAKRMILTGQVITSDEAKNLGIVDFIFDEKNINKEVKKITEQLSQNSLEAMLKAKSVLLQTLEPVVQPGLELEQEAFLEVFKSKEAKNRLLNFVNRRKK